MEYEKEKKTTELTQGSCMHVVTQQYIKTRGEIRRIGSMERKRKLHKKVAKII
jgi:hypothetical protein